VPYTVIKEGKMTVSVRLNKQEDAIIRQYASLNNISLSDLFRQSVMQRIEDEYDLKAYEKAKAEYEKDPKTYTLDEIKAEFYTHNI
jgi:hypothetical protein